MIQLICYCFACSREEFEKDLRRNGRSTILEKIDRQKQPDRCDCALKNPKGK